MEYPGKDNICFPFVYTLPWTPAFGHREGQDTALAGPLVWECGCCSQGDVHPAKALADGYVGYLGCSDGTTLLCHNSGHLILQVGVAASQCLVLALYTGQQHCMWDSFPIGAFGFFLHLSIVHDTTWVMLFKTASMLVAGEAQTIDCLLK